MRAEDLSLVLHHLFPDADHVYGIRVEMQSDGSGRIAGWTHAAPQPTLADLTAALPAAQVRQAARQELRDLQGMLDERYVLWARAQASGNTVDATEIQGEIQDILAYMQEVRDAAGAA